MTISLNKLGIFTFSALVAVFAVTSAQAGPFSGKYDESSSFSEKAAGLTFHQTLFSEYQKLSTNRDRAFADNVDAELFNHKALLASTRTAVQQDSVLDRVLTVQEQPIFKAAFDRLNRVFEHGARELAPVESATAQVAFDCWIEATEDKRQKDADSCKARFEQNLAAAEAKSPYRLGQFQPAPAPEAAPPPPPPVQIPPQEYYMVPFNFDKTTMTPEGEQVLQKAITDLRDLDQLKIALRAHADRSGPNDYNLKLSKRRAEAVLNRMSAAGIPQERLRIVEAVGESRSLVPTPDGVKEQANRVVEIDLRQ